MASHPRSGTLIKPQRQSSPTNRNIDLGISRAKEDPPICKSGTPTVNGSNSSSMTMVTLSILKTGKYLKSKDLRTKKVRMLCFGKERTPRTNNGLLSILMERKKKQRMVSILTLAYISIDHSILSQKCQ
jgi:hypothetical protein